MLWLQLVVSAVGLLMAIFTPLGLQVLKRLSVPALSSSKEFFDTMFILPAPTRSVYLIEPTPARTSPLVFPSQRAMGHIPKQALVSVESVVLTALLLSLVFGFSLVIYIGYACATKDQYDLVPASPVYNLPAPLPTVPLAAADIMAHEPLEAGIEGVVGPEQTGAEPDAEIAQDVGQPDVETAQDIPVEAATELDIEPAQDAAAELVAAIADAALAEVEQVPQAVAELDGRPTQAATDRDAAPAQVASQPAEPVQATVGAETPAEDLEPPAQVATDAQAAAPEDLTAETVSVEAVSPPTSPLASTPEPEVESVRDTTTAPLSRPPTPSSPVLSPIAKSSTPLADPYNTFGTPSVCARSLL
ncbi:hypothetical protein OF83DRAFT_360533 [Amylostereum chailletii]|nr:hypothetical protein OF83DRAFT_360533 [Amylostereum chailletii]